MNTISFPEFLIELGALKDRCGFNICKVHMPTSSGESARVCLAFPSSLERLSWDAAVLWIPLDAGRGDRGQLKIIQYASDTGPQSLLYFIYTLAQWMESVPADLIRRLSVD